MNALKHSGDSANIAYYGEVGKPAQETGRIFCEVLHDALQRLNGKWCIRPLPIFRVRVYSTGKGEVRQFDYTPKSKPKRNRLPDRTITRLVREHLAATAKGA